MWFLFFYKLDLFEKEKIHLLIFTVILSTLITNLCLLAYAFYDHHLNFYLAGVPQNDFLYSIFGIGLIEELTKLIPFLVIFLMFRKEFNEPFDYILFMVMAALGFAFEENMMYFYEGTTHTFSARAIYSSMGHMFFSATIAYGIVLAIYRYKNWYRYLVVLLFFLFSITAHGLYDYLIFFDHYYISVLFFLLITKVFIQYINNALNNSTYFDYKVNMQTYNLRQIIAIGISLVFAAEYIYTAWYYSVPKADDLAFDLYKYSCFFVMIYLADHFSHFNLVKGEWGVLKLDFNSFNIHREEENFIGRHVILSRTQKNNNLQEPFNQFPVKATIIDRTSVRYESIWLKKKDIKEHDWFILELETPLQTVNGLKSILLINFTAKAVNLFHKKESAMAMIVKDNKVLEDVNPKSQFILLGNINVANDN
jgi:RsiW-degrading membrane proteinase PrsW (M82 family)